MILSARPRGAAEAFVTDGNDGPAGPPPLTELPSELRRFAAAPADDLLLESSVGLFLESSVGERQEPLVEARSASLERFVLLGELGRGSFGVVHRAFDPRLRREVAIKVMATSVVRQGGVALRRFEREGQALARLRHPGILRVHQIGEHRGQPFLVMDLVHGRSLRELLATGALPRRRTLELLRDVALALGEAHAHGLVHRDISPSNILVADDGRALLIDFGLVRDLDSQAESLTRTGQLLGTPLFFSPEHASGEPDSVIPASDVFSFGGVLYHAITGSFPFPETSYMALLTKIARGALVPLREIAPDVDPRLEEIVHRCLRPTPADRYPDGRALATALSSYLLPAESQPASGGRRRAMAAGVGAVVSLAAGVTASVWGFSPLPEVPPPATEIPVPPETSTADLPPSDAASWLAQARTRRAAGDRPGVVDACNHALVLGGPSAEPLALRAEARHALHDLRSLADAELALQLDPACALALTTRGRLRLGSRDPTGALEDLSRAIELAPEDAVSWAARGLARSMIRDFPGAEADVERALELDPRYGWAWGVRSAIRISRLGSSRKPEELDAVIAFATRGLELDPDQPDALSSRAQAHEAKGDFRAAADDISRALAMRPGAPTYLARRAFHRLQTRDHEGAIDDTTRVIERLPENSPPGDLEVLVACLCYRAYARLERRLPKDIEEAIEDCTRASRLAPKDGRPLAIRALARWRQQDLDQAAIDLAHAAELSPRDPEVFRIQQVIRGQRER